MNFKIIRNVICIISLLAFIVAELCAIFYSSWPSWALSPLWIIFIIDILLVVIAFIAQLLVLKKERKL